MAAGIHINKLNSYMVINAEDQWAKCLVLLWSGQWTLVRNIDIEHWKNFDKNIQTKILNIFWKKNIFPFGDLFVDYSGRI